MDLSQRYDAIFEVKLKRKQMKVYNVSCPPDCSVAHGGYLIVGYINSHSNGWEYGEMDPTERRKTHGKWTTKYTYITAQMSLRLFLTHMADSNNSRRRLCHRLSAKLRREKGARPTGIRL